MNNEATTLHLLEQRLDLQRRKRLERAKDKRENPGGALHRTRVGDLNKFFQSCYGTGSTEYHFPDDDAGRIDALILAQHYAIGNPCALVRVLKRRLPWMDEAAFQELIKEADDNPKFWSAQDLAEALQLTEKRRSDLNIRTIGSVDMTKRQRKARRKEQNTERRSATRRAKGVKPRAEYEAASLSRTKPWEGICSRRTWERRRKAGDASAADASVSAMMFILSTEDRLATRSAWNSSKPLQDISLAKSTIPIIPATEWREAA